MTESSLDAMPSSVEKATLKEEEVYLFNQFSEYFERRSISDLKALQDVCVLATQDLKAAKRKGLELAGDDMDAHVIFAHTVALRPIGVPGSKDK